MSLQIFGFKAPFNKRIVQALVTARLAGVNIEYPDFEFGVTNESEDWARNCHPLGRTPVLQTEEGYLFESNAILRYIARLDKTNSFLYGRTAFEQSSVDAWIDYAANEIDPNAGPIMYNVVFNQTNDLAPKIEGLTTAIAGLERWLENRTFLVGERLTIADIAVAFSLNNGYRYAPAGTDFTKARNTLRWFNTVVNQPKVLEVQLELGCDTSAVKAAAPLPKVKEDKPKEDKKPKEEKTEKDDDEEDEPVVVEEKKKNPLDLLPPSTFVLDQFKREYSNKDTRKEAAPYFFDNFDNAGFTAFYCKYKYNEELTKMFMSGNLVHGWFQRLEACHKYAFGSCIIAGEENNHEITGFWVFRGKGLPECITDVEDTVLYTWTEIPDINKERETITDYLAWDGVTFQGKQVDGRVFK